jgi:beta-galactosidase
MLERGYSVSIYMFHGGTDFGWMNGANSSDSKKEYEPDVTSYDYDAALDESGRPTAKYFVFRDVIAKATGVTAPPVPEVAKPIAIAPIPFPEAVSLWDTLPKAIESDRPLAMEDVGQNYGWILYRTHALVEGASTELTLDTPHDYAAVFASGKAVGTLDRRLGQTKVAIPVLDSPHTSAVVHLDILVEDTGRINYSHQLRGERQGLGPYAALNGEPIAGGWEIYPLPMEDVGALKFKKAACTGPCYSRGTFQVDKVGDTFLDTSQLTKGAVWVNGHALGRFWNIGPQKTLYVPGVWLKQGENQVVVFDVDRKTGAMVEGKVRAELGE